MSSSSSSARVRIRGKIRLFENEFERGELAVEFGDVSLEKIRLNLQEVFGEAGVFWERIWDGRV